jgi:hypothetical protein
MTAHSLSQHAQCRMQQRAIPPCLIDWLFEFGAEAYDHHGAQIRYFDRAAKRRLAEVVPAEQLAQFDQKLKNAYLVESMGGTVITVGYRDKKVHRH